MSTAKPEVPRPPRLGGLLAADHADLLRDLDWADVDVRGDFAGVCLGQLQVQGARVTSSKFVGADLQRARIIDAVIDGSDLSGARIDEAALTRVEFRDCRLSGAQFNASRLTDMRFTGCRLDGASFRMVRGDRVWFEDCVLTEAELYAAELSAARFERCELGRADFSQARIPDARLVGSTLDDIRGIGGLQRPVIDATQVVQLAYALMAVHGVVIQDLEDDG